jgi:dihydropteroate synthase
MINCGGKLIDLSSPKIMGIMNITPDSFYSKSRFVNKEDITKQTEKIIENGGDIIDIGAYSSRPGATHIDKDEEWNRLAPALETIRNINSNIIISVDTFRAEIAKNL